ncbi:MAG: hypothetical protein GXO27_00970, partial [Chlorobi bacterium]|nr:hypothetical protein [Chlorobiota bacterium]
IIHTNPLKEIEKIFTKLKHSFRDIVIIDPYLLPNIQKRGIKRGISEFIQLISKLSDKDLNKLKNIYIISNLKIKDPTLIKQRLQQIFLSADESIKDKITLLHSAIDMHDRFIITNKFFLEFSNSFYKDHFHSRFSIDPKVIFNTDLLKGNFMDERMNQLKKF